MKVSEENLIFLFLCNIWSMHKLKLWWIIISIYLILSVSTFKLQSWQRMGIRYNAIDPMWKQTNRGLLREISQSNLTTETFSRLSMQQTLWFCLNHIEVSKERFNNSNIPTHLWSIIMLWLIACSCDLIFLESVRCVSTLCIFKCLSDYWFRRWISLQRFLLFILCISQSLSPFIRDKRTSMLLLDLFMLLLESTMTVHQWM